MKNKIKKIVESTEIPFGVGGFYIEIFSENEIVLTGNIEVTDLDKSVIKIKCRNKNIRFGGENLQLSCYTADGLKISGKIDKIEFS